MKKDNIDEITPGELFSLLSGKQSPIDPNKSIEEMSYGELLMLEEHPDLLAQWKRERKKILQSESLSEDEDEVSIGELVKRLYGSRDR